MNIRQKRLCDAIRQYAGEIVLEYEQNHTHDFGMISIVEVIITDDYGYADIFLGSGANEKELAHFLAPCGDAIRKKIGKELSLRKIPIVRLKIAKEQRKTSDILSLIHSLDTQYGLSSHENS